MITLNCVRAVFFLLLFSLLFTVMYLLDGFLLFLSYDIISRCKYHIFYAAESVSTTGSPSVTRSLVFGRFSFNFSVVWNFFSTHFFFQKLRWQFDGNISEHREKHEIKPYKVSMDSIEAQNNTRDAMYISIWTAQQYEFDKCFSRKQIKYIITSCVAFITYFTQSQCIQFLKRRRREMKKHQHQRRTRH